MPSHENQRQHDRHKRLLALAAAGLDGDCKLEPGTSPNAAGPEIEGMFGPYRLERSLGHGGQGIVYLAEDTRLGRKVALKLLSAQGAAGDTARARFEREATAASRLHHPGICTVYEAGEIDGNRFLAMEYVDGECLSEWIAHNAEDRASGDSGQRRTRVEQAFQLVEGIARAVHTANQAGVVHRDLKPQNIMLRRDGSPVVLDFGLARDDSEQETLLTIQGDVLGTPAYMPPERVRGIAGSSADPREDVYGLGAVLYECLTGQRPFRGHTREQLYRHILTQPVDDPRKTDPTIPREARFVVETAMEKEPDRRYASALELADELLRLQKREPIRARPVPRWLRLVRWVQRNPAAAIPTIGAFGVLAAGIVTALLLLAEVGSEARHATIRALLAESALQLNRDPQRALLLAKEASDQLDQGAPPELRVAVRSQLVEVLAQTRLVTKFSHGDIMVGAGFSGDSQRVATVARGKNGPAVRLWSADGKREIANYAVPKSIDGNPDQLTCCAFDEDGARLLITPYGGVARVVSLEDGRLLHELRPAKEEPAIIQFNHSLLRLAPGKLACFVPGQPDLVLTGSLDGARIWRLTPGQLQATELWHDPRPHTLAGRVDGVSQVAVSADGHTVAAGEHGGIVRVLRTEPAKNTHRPIVVGQQQAHQRPVHALVFDPKRPLLLTSARDEQIAVWSTEPAGSEEQEPKLARVGSLQLEGQNAIFLHVAPPSPGRRSVLAVLDDNRSVHLFRSTDAPPYFERYANLQTHDTDVQTITFAPDGSRFGSGSIDGVARIFDLSGRLQKTLRGGSAFMSASAWSSGGESILVTGTNGETHLWRDRDPVFRVEHLPGTIERLAAAGTRLAGVMRNGSILVVDLESDSVAIARPDTTESINTRGTGNSFALRSDGMRLATGHNLGRLELWDLTGPAPRREPPVSGLGRNNLRLDRLDFGADGTLFIAAGRHMRALSPGGTLRQIGELPGGRVTTAATRRGVAAIGVRAAMWDCEQQVLDKRGILLPDGMLRVHDQGVLPYASTSADGRWMVLHDWASQRIRVVDADAREPHRAWSVPGLRGAAIDADGRRVLTTGVHGSATLWDLSFDPPRQIVELRGHKGTVWAAAFHPNGDELITAGSDGTVRFWPANFDGLEQLVKERLVRDWTEAEKARYAALLDR